MPKKRKNKERKSCLSHNEFSLFIVWQMSSQEHQVARSHHWHIVSCHTHMPTSKKGRKIPICVNSNSNLASCPNKEEKTFGRRSRKQLHIGLGQPGLHVDVTDSCQSQERNSFGSCHSKRGHTQGGKHVEFVGRRENKNLLSRSTSFGRQEVTRDQKPEDGRRLNVRLHVADVECLAEPAALSFVS